MIARTGNVTTFARMTPKMSAALVAAEACDACGGLQLTGHAWKNPEDDRPHHSATVVACLTFLDGYLDTRGNGMKRRIITDKGRAWLAHARREGWIKDARP